MSQKNISNKQKNSSNEPKIVQMSQNIFHMRRMNYKKREISVYLRLG